MPISAFLKDYANNYDSFYKDKDYKAEAMALDKIFQEHKVSRILDIACGTGRHMKFLNQLGYITRGLDISPDMVKKAQAKWLDASVCAMQDIDLEEEYDAVICMFASFDYLVNKSDAFRTIENVYKALKPKGIFVFDFWNKEVVERDYKPMRSGRGKMSFTTMGYWEDVAKIDIHFGKHSETHLMRYYNPKDIELMLNKFENIKMIPYDNDWSIQVICSKPQLLSPHLGGTNK